MYIKENSRFVPYLVLTSEYNRQALLLRKDLLNQAYILIIMMIVQAIKGVAL